jgi:carboxylate-amine ligase
MLDHAFNGPDFTIGIEEELMILEPEGFALAQAIEDLLAHVPAELEGQVKPEFLQCVLEIATRPHPNVRSACDELRALRRAVIEVASRCDLLIGAAGTHHFARWEDQQIVERERYRELANELGFILRQFVIFGTHVHVGIEGADRAIHVADGIRRHLPLLLALSANSPFHRGYPTGMHSSRTPVFRALPRSGIPPHFGSFEEYSRRIELLMKTGSIDDYTFVWWDVRPHPRLGTVETRIFDQQTRIEHTEALTALVASLAHRLATAFDAGETVPEHPAELIDDSKVRAAIRGLDGSLVDFDASSSAPARELAQRLLDEVRPGAAELGCEAELAGIEDLLRTGTGAARQLAMFERHPDLDELMREVVERTGV